MAILREEKQKAISGMPKFYLLKKTLITTPFFGKIAGPSPKTPKKPH